MDELFTQRAKAVLAIAQEEAKYFKHQAVGSEHILLALNKTGLPAKPCGK